MVETLKFRRGNLPHWLVADHTYFVTIRLINTIPKSVVAELEAQRTALAHLPSTAPQRTNLARQQFVRIDQILHAVDPSRDWLTRPGIPEIILDNLVWLEWQRGWRINAATVLSNHVHLLLRNHAGRSGFLLHDLGAYKAYVAAVINRCLNRQGTLWAHEGFDHWCRNDEKVRQVAYYICMNPVRAGLVNDWRAWPWTRCVDWLQPVADA